MSRFEDVQHKEVIKTDCILNGKIQSGAGKWQCVEETQGGHLFHLPRGWLRPSLSMWALIFPKSQNRLVFLICSKSSFL